MRNSCDRLPVGTHDLHSAYASADALDHVQHHLAGYPVVEHRADASQYSDGVGARPRALAPCRELTVYVSPIFDLQLLIDSSRKAGSHSVGVLNHFSFATMVLDL